MFKISENTDENISIFRIKLRVTTYFSNFVPRMNTQEPSNDVIREILSLKEALKSLRDNQEKKGRLLFWEKIIILLMTMILANSEMTEIKSVAPEMLKTFLESTN